MYLTLFEDFFFINILPLSSFLVIFTALQHDLLSFGEISGLQIQ